MCVVIGGVDRRAVWVIGVCDAVVCGLCRCDAVCVGNLECVTLCVWVIGVCDAVCVGDWSV